MEDELDLDKGGADDVGLPCWSVILLSLPCHLIAGPYLRSLMVPAANRCAAAQTFNASMIARLLARYWASATQRSLLTMYSTPPRSLRLASPSWNSALWAAICGRLAMRWQAASEEVLRG